MTEVQFPKGPWRVNAWDILNSWGRKIIQLFPSQYPSTADIALRDLLLAAPDMYEALEGVCHDCDDTGTIDDECKSCHIYKALLKARGETE